MKRSSLFLLTSMTRISKTFPLRDDIHRAADVYICLGSYNSYTCSLAALEGLSRVSVAVISTSCGVTRRVQMNLKFESNIILVNYVKPFEKEVLGDFF